MGIVQVSMMQRGHHGHRKPPQCVVPRVANHIFGSKMGEADSGTLSAPF